MSSSEALDLVAQLHSIDRWEDFSSYERSAEFLDRKMTEFRLRNIEMIPAPADGVSQFGWWTMPLAWDVKQATLELIEPAPAPGMRILCDYRQEPASLIQWSGSTPPGGVTAEVMQLDSTRVEDLKGLHVKGKMILVEAPAGLAERGALKAALYKMGAAGIISDYTENRDLRDGHYWVNAWGDHGWGYTKTSTPMVGFSITPRQGDYLRSLLRRGEKVRVKADAETRYYPGSYYTVTGVIPGGGSDEEVLELGHGFELGAQDNSTGQAGMLEAIAAVNRAIEAGKLPRPKRSIRILTMSEDYGSSHYVASHMDRMKRTVGAMHMDVAAGDYNALGAYSFNATPDVTRSYHDALIMRIAETYYSGSNRMPMLAPYSATSDTWLSEPMIGVPTIAARGSSGAIPVHHNSADTLDRVDPRSLGDLSSLAGSYLYWLASAGEAEIPWLASVTLDRSYDNAIRAAAPYLDRVMAGGDGTVLYQGLAKIQYNAGRDEQAILSTLRLAPPERRDAIRTASLEPLLKIVRRFADEQSERLRQAAKGVEPVAPPADPRRAEAATMIITRKKFGPVTLDDLALEERQGFPGFGDSPAPLRLLYWNDGKRPLSEVIRLIELEQGPMNFDFVGYFKLLAKHGYVEITKK